MLPLSAAPGRRRWRAVVDRLEEVEHGAGLPLADRVTAVPDRVGEAPLQRIAVRAQRPVKCAGRAVALHVVGVDGVAVDGAAELDALAGAADLVAGLANVHGKGEL